MISFIVSYFILAILVAVFFAWVGLYVDDKAVTIKDLLLCYLMSVFPIVNLLMLTAGIYFVVQKYIEDHYNLSWLDKVLFEKK